MNIFKKFFLSKMVTLGLIFIPSTLVASSLDNDPEIQASKLGVNFQKSSLASWVDEAVHATHGPYLQQQLSNIFNFCSQQTEDYPLTLLMRVNQLELKRHSIKETFICSASKESALHLDKLNSIPTSLLETFQLKEWVYSQCELFLQSDGFVFNKFIILMFLNSQSYKVSFITLNNLLYNPNLCQSYIHKILSCDLKQDSTYPRLRGYILKSITDMFNIINLTFNEGNNLNIKHMFLEKLADIDDAYFAFKYGAQQPLEIDKAPDEDGSNSESLPEDTRASTAPQDISNNESNLESPPEDITAPTLDQDRLSSEDWSTFSQMYNEFLNELKENFKNYSPFLTIIYDDLSEGIGITFKISYYDLVTRYQNHQRNKTLSEFWLYMKKLIIDKKIHIKKYLFEPYHQQKFKMNPWFVKGIESIISSGDKERIESYFRLLARGYNYIDTPGLFKGFVSLPVADVIKEQHLKLFEDFFRQFGISYPYYRLENQIVISRQTALNSDQSNIIESLVKPDFNKREEYTRIGSFNYLNFGDKYFNDTVKLSNSFWNGPVFIKAKHVTLKGDIDAALGLVVVAEEFDLKDAKIWSFSNSHFIKVEPNTINLEDSAEITL